MYIMIKYNLGVCIFDQVNENAQLSGKVGLDLQCL